ncbi:hypothetical protein DMB44_03005 [Thermoplasma sp. Kam2015]|uniref:hypothetical protein n=1 Tax=Thermoplasma sp. Kam2015 TaxID=2094122 RepID=UPI000D9FB847|nr:hypothetical protein [Thermoplasma sp. Kam2015]PYB68590.1 hypothetical protein DMB44_03005 [Thermoplasma sp. Kam2015]
MINWVRGISVALLFIGLAFYLSWSIMYGTWFDIGLYSFTIVLIVFGVLGIMLTTVKDEDSVSS